MSDKKVYPIPMKVKSTGLRRVVEYVLTPLKQIISLLVGGWTFNLNINVNTNPTKQIDKN